MSSDLSPPVRAAMNAWVERDLLNGDVQLRVKCKRCVGQGVFHAGVHAGAVCSGCGGNGWVAPDWTGHLAETEQQRRDANGRAVMLCEVLQQRKGWYFRKDQSLDGWVVEVRLIACCGCIIADASNKHLPAGVCEAAYRAWTRERGN